MKLLDDLILALGPRPENQSLFGVLLQAQN